MKLEQHFSNLCRSAGDSTEQMLWCGQHRALPCALSCARCCLNISWLLTVLKAFASTGLLMKHGLGIVAPQLFSNFLLWICMMRHACPAHCAIPEDLPSYRNVASAHLFIPRLPASPCFQFSVYCKIYKISSTELSSSSGENLNVSSMSL